MRFLDPPWPAVALASLVLAGGLVLLLVGLRNPSAGRVSPAPRCRRSADCVDRTACLATGRCGHGGRLRLAVEVPPAGGNWSWLHVTLRDRDRQYGERTTSWPLRDHVAFPDVDQIPEGRWEVEFHASGRPAADAACAGDLRQEFPVTVDRGMTRIDGADRRRRGPLLLGMRVARPPCAADR